MRKSCILLFKLKKKFEKRETPLNTDTGYIIVEKSFYDNDAPPCIALLVFKIATDANYCNLRILPIQKNQENAEVMEEKFIYKVRQKIMCKALISKIFLLLPHRLCFTAPGTPEQMIQTLFFAVLQLALRNFTVRMFAEGKFAVGNFAVGNLTVWKFHCMDILPYGRFPV